MTSLGENRASPRPAYHLMKLSSLPLKSQTAYHGFLVVPLSISPMHLKGHIQCLHLLVKQFLRFHQEK